MEVKELRQKTLTELQQLIKEKREALVQLRFDLASGKVKNVRTLQETKKEIAQILTLLKQKNNI